MPLRVLVLLLAAAAACPAQSASTAPWQMQDSGTTAGLRGIDSVDGTVAWASGTGGTVLRTVDGGAHWTRCATPDADKDGATLDFRGVQAWDAQTAIVMASGPGDKSRLYKTTDGCKTWKLLFKNPEQRGFLGCVRGRSRHADVESAGLIPVVDRRSVAIIGVHRFKGQSDCQRLV